MKLFFMSDIHGSLYYLKKAIEAFQREKADYIIILGDELYHGPRNSLTKEYNTKETANLLNEYKDKIIAVRGNCDSDVDQMMLKYPMMSDYNIILYENKKLFITHGHIYNKTNLPNLTKDDVFIYGHTHIPLIEKADGIIFINPGSISLPKGGYENSYGVLEDMIFTIKTFDNKIIISNSIE